jgi:sulfatase maturation enzyme AslB (radical SAM superfamily)
MDNQQHRVPFFFDSKFLRNLCCLLQHATPGQLVIQFTNHCNATCPQCGMRITNKIERNRIPVNDIKRIIDAAARRKIQSISFTGGEPLLFIDDLAELIDHANQAGIPMIRTGTNGFIFRNSDEKEFNSRVQRVAKKLYDSGLRNFWISIDSANPTLHEKMRGLTGVMDNLKKGLRIFHDAGLFPTANMGINRNMAGWLTAGIKRQDYCSENDYLKNFFERFKKGFECFISSVIRMGFTMVSFCYPMSIDNEKTTALKPVYAAISTNQIVAFDAMEKAQIFTALRLVTERFREQIKIFSPQCALYSLSRQYAEQADHTYPCRGGLDYFFIDSNDGLSHPCGYRGKDLLGKFEQGLRSTIRNCRLCDWECFRDPSELFGPIHQLVSEPLKFLQKLKRDQDFFKYWMADIRYYLACDLFNGRNPLQREKLKHDRNFNQARRAF